MAKVELLIQTNKLKVAVGPLLTELNGDAFTPNEWKRLSEKKRNDQRMQSASALLLARELMKSNASILHDSSGRPFSTDLDWNVSLSHSSFLVAAGLARAPLRIGIDIENLRELRDFSVLQKYVPAVGEDLQPLADLWKCDEHRALIALWSLKESFFKAVSEDLIPQSLRFKLSSQTLMVERLVQGEWEPIEGTQIEVFFRGDHVITAIAF